MLIKKVSTLVVVVLIFSFLTPVAKAVTFDSASSNGAFNSVIDVAPPLTWSHTVGSGLSRALFVGVSTHTTTANVANRVSSVTYGAQAMTRISPVLPAISSDGLNAVEMFVLVNPPTGTDTVTVTFNTQVGILQDYSVGGSASFFSVDQTTPNRAFVSSSGTGTGPIVNVPNSLVGDIVLDTLAVSPNAVFVAPGADQTQRWDGEGFFGNAFDVGAGSTEPATGINTVMSWTTTTSDNWVLGAVAVARITSAAGVSLVGRVLTADGRGIRGARVAITHPSGTVVNSLSNGFGYYRFDDIPAGSGYVVSVRSKGYSFTPRTVDLQDDLGDLDFVANPLDFREK